MKKNRLIGFIGLILILISLPVIAFSAPKYVFKMVTVGPDSNRPAEMELKQWMKDVGTATNGQVRIDCYWNTLGKPPDFFKMLDSGLIDIANAGAGNYPDTFPITTIVSQPFLFPGPSIAGTYLNMLLKKGLLKEYDDIKLICLFPGTTLKLFTNKPVKNLEDLKGLKIRSTHSGVIKALKTLGATPTAIPASELYTALERKVIDGVVTNYDYFFMMKMNEILKYCVPEPFGITLLATFMKKEKWDKLPKDIQLAIDEESEKFYYTAILGTSSREVNDYGDLLKKSGMTLNYLTDEESERWHGKTASQAGEWAKDMDAKGLPGTEALGIAKILSKVK